MTKRATGAFKRREMDFYPTPKEAVYPLLPHLKRTGVKTFVEPCSGEGQLIDYLTGHGYQCMGDGDITDDFKTDARAWDVSEYRGVDVVITNPPWERFTMAGIMEHQSTFVPAWFLIYSDWLFTRQSARLVQERCTDIVPVGRVKWIPGSASVGFDNCCWVCMNIGKKQETVFWPMI